jgi:hypothetical protein
MAKSTFHLTSGVDAQGWCALSESAQSAATTASGWTVGTGATNHSELEAGVERAASTFTGTTPPDGTLDTTLKDALRTPDALTLNFAPGEWQFDFGLIAVTNGGAQDGRIRFRVIKADADGSNATEVTSGQQQASLVTDLGTGAEQVSSLAVELPRIELSNQYLFFQLAWERTGAGGMTNADALLRTGTASTGTRIVSSEIESPAGAYTGAQVPGGQYLQETGTFQAQIPGGPFVNETVAGGSGPQSGSVSESVAVADTQSAANTTAGIVAESTAAAESQSVVATLPASVSESVSAVDSTDAVVGGQIGTVAESVVAAETQSATMVTAGAVAESVAAADTSTAARLVPAAVAESVVAAESQAAVATFPATVAESVAAADTSNGFVGSVVAEVLATADTVNATVVHAASVAETFSAQEAAGATAVMGASIAETVTAVDAPEVTWGGSASVLESFAAIDSTNATVGVIPTFIAGPRRRHIVAGAPQTAHVAPGAGDARLGQPTVDDA